MQEAVGWFRKCAERGHGGCMHNLAVCYEHGVGVEVSHVESVRASPHEPSATTPQRRLTLHTFWLDRHGGRP